MRRRLAIGAAAVLGLVVLAAGRGGAGPITYTETVVGSGSLGGTSFTDSLITVTATADTNDILNPATGFFQVGNASVAIQVAGVGSGMATIPGTTFVNQTTQVVG